MNEFGEGRIDYLPDESVRLRDTSRPIRDYSARAKKKRRGGLDVPFLALTLVILAIGVIMVLSASFAGAYYSDDGATFYFGRQLLFAVLGVAAMLVISRMPVSLFRRLTPVVAAVSLILLVVVLAVGTGEEESGARRWIDLKITTFQPSELAKIAEIMLFSQCICICRDKRYTITLGKSKKLKLNLPIVALVFYVGATVLLLKEEPHLSAMIIIAAIAVIMAFAGGIRIIWLALGSAVAVVGGYFAVAKLGYAMDRITAWRNPEADPLDTGYQILQSLYAVGSGGLLGLGIGQGRQKYLYLPEEHNDYIFAIVCEELGYIGAILILLLFALLIARGFWLALHIRDRYSSLLVTGISALLSIQVFLNVAVVTNLIPSTGISLPFFSYGGTALVMQLAEMGIVLSASRDIPLRKAK